MAETATAAPSTKPTHTEVTLEDGSTTKFAGETQINTAFIPADSPIGSDTKVRLQFRNGRVLDTPLNHGDLLYRYAAHGIIQKLRDEVAGLKDASGAKASVDDQYEVIRELWERLAEGKWSEGREGGFAGQSILLKAIVRAMSVTEEEARAFLKDLKPAEKKAMRYNVPEIKAAAEAIEQEAASSVDIKSHVERLIALRKPATA